MDFYHPEPRNSAHVIYPVFIPFAGCARRCIFCAQTAQTGQAERTAQAALAGLAQALKLRAVQGGAPVELAFYGGTFSALPLAEQLACLELAAELREKGLLCALRCSTRPDAIDEKILARFKEYGLNTVELGVQSFSPAALAASGRAYDGALAVRACEMVREYGLVLGIQLLPGLPGSSPEDFLRDIETTAGLAPDFARLYPCLVLEGTGLAELWRAGSYAPWELEPCLDRLAAALPRLWNAGIKVVRLGLAQEQSLAGQILAGPVHPNLGGRARARALLDLVRNALAAFGKTPQALYCPRRFQGEIWGQSGELKPIYAGLDLLPEKLHWWDEDYFRLL